MSEMIHRLEQQAQNGQLVEHFAKEYMEKLFYFCLRKTGRTVEAEDLASDITLNIIASLRRGITPQNFPAWVWQIARNRYSVWAEQRHIRCEQVLDADIAELEVAGEDSFTDKLIHDEDICLLRRELAFISSDYRKIIVAFYIDDRSVRDIASSLGIAEGTVKSKLFRARKILKEGMNMAREFGTMSYRPEEVRFIMNGVSGREGEPFSIVSGILNKNILLAAYRTPSTAEVLSVELGVAVPYMEEALGELVDSTLLRKNGDQYETSFCIVSAEAQAKTYGNVRKIAPELLEKVIALMELEEQKYEEAGARWHEGYQSYNDMKWARLVGMVDHLCDSCIDKQKEYTKRPNGGQWDLTGFEDYSGDIPAFVGEHGCGRHEPGDELDYVAYGQFKFDVFNLKDKTPMHLSYEQVRGIVAAAKQSGSVSQRVTDYLCETGYLRKEGDRYVPNIMVTRKSEQDKVSGMEETALWQETCAVIKAHYQLCCAVIADEIPQFMRNDKHQIREAVSHCVSAIRGGVIDEALKTGYIRYDEDHWQGLGSYLVI